MDTKITPKDIKIFKPEPDKPSNTIRTAILLALLLSAAGVAFFKPYFIPKPEVEIEPDAVKQTASDKEGNLAHVPQSEKEPPASDSSMSPHASAVIPKASAGKDVTADRSHKNLTESLEDKVEKGFQKKEGSHFTVKFEGGENSDIGYLISIILEEAYIKVGADLGYYPEDRIEAVLYAQQQFTDVTRAPSWAGAIYDGRIKIPAGGITSRTNLLERVLFHEYAHALVHRLSKARAPVWLNEGIAQYVEGSVDEGINRILAQVAKMDKPIPLRPFEGSFMGYNNMQASVAYSVSLSATAYIINEFGMSAVKRILGNLGEGKTIEEAVSSSLYISYEDLQSNWFMSLKKKFAG